MTRPNARALLIVLGSAVGVGLCSYGCWAFFVRSGHVRLPPSGRGNDSSSDTRFSYQTSAGERIRPRPYSADASLFGDLPAVIESILFEPLKAESLEQLELILAAALDRRNLITETTLRLLLADLVSESASGHARLRNPVETSSILLKDKSASEANVAIYVQYRAHPTASAEHLDLHRLLSLWPRAVDPRMTARIEELLGLDERAFDARIRDLLASGAAADREVVVTLLGELVTGARIGTPLAPLIVHELFAVGSENPFQTVTDLLGIASFAQRFQMDGPHRGMMSLTMDASLELMGAANTARGPLAAAMQERLLGAVEGLHVSGREPGDGMMLAILMAHIPSALATNALVEVVTDPNANVMVRESALVSLGSHLSPRQIVERIGLNFSDPPNSDAELNMCRSFVVSVHNSLSRDQAGIEYAESTFRRMLAWNASPTQDDIRIAVLNSFWVAKMPGLTVLATSLSSDETHPAVAAAARHLLARLAKSSR